MYASKDVLRKHIKTVHFKDGFRCNKCNTKYDQKRKLDVHMQEHNKHNSAVIVSQDAQLFLQQCVFFTYFLRISLNEMNCLDFQYS